MDHFIFKENLSVRLPHWTSCVVEIQDAGKTTFWGRLVDIKTNEVVQTDVIFSIDEDWQVVLDVGKFLKSL